jgi:hypothetical protein
MRVYLAARPTFTMFFVRLALPVLDGRAFVYGNEDLWVVLHESESGVGAFGRGQGFDIHHEDAQLFLTLGVRQRKVAQLLAVAVGDVRLPAHDLVRNAVGQVHWDFRRHPVVEHALWRKDQRRVNSARFV